MDLVVLVEHDGVERTGRRKSDNLDMQAMGMFLIGSVCRQVLAPLINLPAGSY
jgi:hypothetical protein